jgi:DNA-binding transcriptional MerR regulator
MSEATTYSIGELAQEAGVSRRTVRFYVQQGLLSAPSGLGRGAHYGREHLAVLQRIKQMQLQGAELGEIAEILGAETRGEGRGEREEHDVPVRTPDTGPRTPDVGPRTPDVGPRTAIPTAVGSVVFRQPLASGYDLYVTAPGRPLSPQELAELGLALSRLIHDRSREDR